MKKHTNTWEDVPILPNMTSTALNATNMILKPNSLSSSSRFKLMLVITSQVGSEGFGELEFETAGSPHSGYCKSSASGGVALKTKFTFECFGWQDKSKPINYEFRLGDDPISYGISPKSASTVLPAGKPEDNYRLPIKIIIKNFVGVAVEKAMFVKVRNSLRS